MWTDNEDFSTYKLLNGLSMLTYRYAKIRKSRASPT